MSNLSKIDQKIKDFLDRNPLNRYTVEEIANDLGYIQGSVRNRLLKDKPLLINNYIIKEKIKGSSFIKINQNKHILESKIFESLKSLLLTAKREKKIFRLLKKIMIIFPQKIYINELDLNILKILFSNDLIRSEICEKCNGKWTTVYDHLELFLHREVVSNYDDKAFFKVGRPSTKWNLNPQWKENLLDLKKYNYALSKRREIRANRMIKNST